MQGWMIALIIVASVIAILAIAFLAGSLAAVHIILGRRKEASAEYKAKNGYAPENYGINMQWFDGVKNVSETLSLTAYDGVPLVATLIKQPEHLGRVAICCHGYGASERSMQVQAKLFYDRGFDVLLPSMRGHGESGGKVGMAWIDRFDLLRWIDKVIELYGEKISIALCGISMGGSTVIAASGMKPPSQVKCVIDDCGFSSQKDIYASRVKSQIALLPLKVGVRLVHGYSIDDANITALAQCMTIPALFIHGDADKFVPFALGQRLYDACASEDKKFIAIPNAGHAYAYAVDKQKYSDEFNAFIDKHIVGSEFIFDSDSLIPEPQEPAPQTADTSADQSVEKDGDSNDVGEPAPQDKEEPAQDGASAASLDD